MLVARRLLVSGRVQGVGFRYFACEAAQVEGLHGWVANLDDGRVEVWMEGDHEAVDRVERKIRRGPPAARVETVERLDQLPSGQFRGFDVRRGG